jgi:hypothetical protein
VTKMEWDNSIYLEYGVKHTLTREEIGVLQKALKEVEVDEEHQDSLNALQAIFIHHMD